MAYLPKPFPIEALLRLVLIRRPLIPTPAADDRNRYGAATPSSVRSICTRRRFHNRPFNAALIAHEHGVAGAHRHPLVHNVVATVAVVLDRGQQVELLDERAMP